ncbi:hypothetical protein DFJ58DRAFT_845647 [Suillus subalutaceus]|uniref:uncharacterized protein n=1 Tax=Suillus subalutaceus TaxID=48586 RepID=UPI001B886780|nr:uncharacterized protein DFJ58DRAFT_845647 [Suillus subalutaceus]KAG1839668.1 hypothetical protein DFJ58DRAFT_845647 [Suillus subalutaceus]
MYLAGAHLVRSCSTEGINKLIFDGLSTIRGKLVNDTEQVLSSLDIYPPDDSALSDEERIDYIQQHVNVCEARKAEKEGWGLVTVKGKGFEGEICYGPKSIGKSFEFLPPWGWDGETWMGGAPCNDCSILKNVSSSIVKDADHEFQDAVIEVVKGLCGVGHVGFREAANWCGGKLEKDSVVVGTVMTQNGPISFCQGNVHKDGFLLGCWDMWGGRRVIGYGKHEGQGLVCLGGDMEVVGEGEVVCVLGRLLMAKVIWEFSIVGWIGCCVVSSVKVASIGILFNVGVFAIHRDELLVRDQW